MGQSKFELLADSVPASDLDAFLFSGFAPNRVQSLYTAFHPLCEISVLGASQQLKCLNT